MTKMNKNDWRPVATTDVSLTTTGALLTTTDSSLTTIDDHWRPQTTICRLLIAVLCLMSYGCSNGRQQCHSREGMSSPTPIGDGNTSHNVIPAKAGTRATSPEPFPQIMVGVWEAKVDDENKWGIKFEADGSIKKIIHSVAGPVRLEEGGVSVQGEEPNKIMMFQMGPCTAEYDAKTKVLNVKIIVDYYRMELPQGTLEGKMEDQISGHISIDSKTWKVKWWNYGELEGANKPDPNMIKANPIHLTFYKVEIK